MGKNLDDVFMVYWRYYPSIFLEVIRKPRKVSVKIAGDLDKLRTEHLTHRITATPPR
jgi:hypothetical protein